MLSLLIKIARVVACFALFWFASSLIAHAQSTDAVADLLTRINRERIARGLTPYALNAQLTTAAQAHANDLAKSGKIRTPDEGHVGADGSTIFDRVARTGYGAYSWGRRLGENWAHYRDSATAFSEWMDSTPHRNNILHPLYREIGIGVALSSLGGYIYIIDFGAQPNVLPIFINDTAVETKSADVTITLGDEQVAPNGDNANNMGHPVQVQISNSADFANAKWQSYASKINWTLTQDAGTKTVYVKYRDAKGRTATANDSIVLKVATTPSLTATRTSTRAPQPSATTITKIPTPTETATLTPIPTETPTPPTIAPTQTATPTETPTTTLPIAPTPTATPTITASPVLSDEIATGVNSAAMSAVGLTTVIAILVTVVKEMLKR